MRYTDGFELDENYRVKICPRCENEEFSPDAIYCRICGAMLFNRCKGKWDDYNQEWCWEHENPGNARFCEKCGKPTYFSIEKFLLDWKEAKAKLEEGFYPDSMDEEESFQVAPAEIAATEEDDLPF